MSNSDGNRGRWVAMLDRLSGPVLEALAEGKLRAVMPVEKRAERDADCTYLEAFGRLLTGIAPWLESSAGDAAEVARRKHYRELTRRALAAGFDPESPDYLFKNIQPQHLVDAAFLAHAILRAPTELWRKVPAQTQEQMARALELTRAIKPGFNNWLLFSAMVEAALRLMGRTGDLMRVDYAVRQHLQWYKGDGMYGDGPEFHFDNYNSYVIQPMLLDVVAAFPECASADERRTIDARAARYAAIQERLIMPDGSFPTIGRSICYRCGAFHHLAHVALARKLPAELPPAQAREALWAVIHRTLGVPGTFGSEGFLRIGLAGHQPALGEVYITTGSLYLCAAALLPLGLPAEDAFWSGAAVKWTQARVWAGEDVAADHAFYG